MSEGSGGGFFASLGKHRYILAGLLAVGAVLITVGIVGSRGGSADAADDRTDYELRLEERVKHLCESVDGIDEATVLVTVDAVPGESAARYGASGETMPTVRGVAVAATRGDDPVVRRTLTELISSSLGIPTSRVSVAPCKQRGS